MEDEQNTTVDRCESITIPLYSAIKRLNSLERLRRTVMLTNIPRTETASSLYLLLLRECPTLMDRSEQDPAYVTARRIFEENSIRMPPAVRAELGADVAGIRPLRRRIRHVHQCPRWPHGEVLLIQWESEEARKEHVAHLRPIIASEPRRRGMRICWADQMTAPHPLTDFDYATGRPCTFGFSDATIEEVNRIFGFQPPPPTHTPQ